MMSFRSHLKEKLADPQFRQLYEEERQLAELSLRIQDARKDRGLSQRALAERAVMTPRQLAKVENGINCRLATFLKVCNALGLRIDLGQKEVV